MLSHVLPQVELLEEGDKAETAAGPFCPVAGCFFHCSLSPIHLLCSIYHRLLPLTQDLRTIGRAGLNGCHFNSCKRRAALLPFCSVIFFAENKQQIFLLVLQCAEGLSLPFFASMAGISQNEYQQLKVFMAESSK